VSGSALAGIGGGRDSARHDPRPFYVDDGTQVENRDE
jgi:hypothetical protein